MDPETADNTTESTIVTMHYQRPGWFKTLKTVLLVCVLIKIMLELSVYDWFYFDQKNAFTYFRIYEMDFKEDQIRVLVFVVISLIIDGLQLSAIYFEIFLLALLSAIWRLLCCIVLIRVINSEDGSTYILALGWTEMVVGLVILVLVSVFTAKLCHIQHQEQMQQYTDQEAQEMRRAIATSPTAI